MTDCSIRSVWRMFQQVVDQVLGKIMLQDLLVSEQQMNAFRLRPGAPKLPTVPSHP